jgi:hypothetical protein
MLTSFLVLQAPQWQKYSFRHYINNLKTSENVGTVEAWLSISVKCEKKITFAFIDRRCTGFI